MVSREQREHRIAEVKQYTLDRDRRAKEQTKHAVEQVRQQYKESLKRIKALWKKRFIAQRTRLERKYSILRSKTTSKLSRLRHINKHERDAHVQRCERIRTQLEGAATANAISGVIDDAIADWYDEKDPVKALIRLKKDIELYLCTASEEDRFRWAVVIMHLLAVSELKRIQENESLAEIKIRKLPPGDLVKYLRAMYQEGKFTLDDIDPPPQTVEYF